MDMKLVSRDVKTGKKIYFMDGESMDKFYETHAEADFEVLGFQMFENDGPVIDCMDENERDFLDLLKIYGLSPEEGKEFIESDESKQLDEEHEAMIEEAIKAGVLKRMTDEEAEEYEKRMTGAPIMNDGKQIPKKMTKDEFVERLKKDAAAFVDKHFIPESEGYNNYITIKSDLVPMLIKDIMKEYPGFYGDLQGIDVGFENIWEASIKYNEKLDMHYVLFSGNDDEEKPVYGIMYIGPDNQYHGYIPRAGNTFNSSNQASFGHGETDEGNVDIDFLQRYIPEIKEKDDINVYWDKVEKKLFSQEAIDRDLEVKFVEAI